MEYILESKFTKTKRKQMEETIYTFFKIIDPSMRNTNHYKAYFSKMSDKEFDKFFIDFFKEEDDYILLHTVDYENDIFLKNAMKALDYLGVPFFEDVAMPYVNGSKTSPVIANRPVPVGYAHIKRMEQAKSKKNKGSSSSSKRSALTNQVTGVDKNGRITDSENYNFIINGGHDIAKEFMSFRADDMVMYEEALASVAEKGYIDMEELTDKKENKTSLNLVDIFFIGMGLKTDLVTDGITLLMSLEDN